jgi:hypothetical protein
MTKRRVKFPHFFSLLVSCAFWVRFTFGTESVRLQHGLIQSKASLVIVMKGRGEGSTMSRENMRMNVSVSCSFCSIVGSDNLPLALASTVFCCSKSRTCFAWALFFTAVYLFCTAMTIMHCNDDCACEIWMSRKASCTVSKTFSMHLYVHRYTSLIAYNAWLSCEQPSYIWHLSFY